MYYRQHHEELVGYATKQLQGDRMTAEDVVQATFLRLLTGQQLITAITLPALVHTALRNQLTDYWRHNQRRQRFESQYSIYATEYSRNDVFTHCSTRQVTGLLERRISRLGDNCARVMRLSIFEECPVSEIARQLSMNYKTAECHLLTGRKVIRPYARRLLASS